MIVRISHFIQCAAINLLLELLKRHETPGTITTTGQEQSPFHYYIDSSSCHYNQRNINDDEEMKGFREGSQGNYVYLLEALFT